MKALLGADSAALIKHFDVAQMVHGSPDIEVKDFLRNGASVRGLSSRVALEPGEPVMIATTDMQLRRPWQGKGTRFANLTDDISRLSFWLAEQRVKLNSPVLPEPVVKNGAEGATKSAGDDDWKTAYVRSLPTLEEYRASGMPLVATDEDLAKISKLPRLQEVSRFVAEEKTKLAQDLAKYNEADIGTHPKLEMEDALWGRIVASSRAMRFGYGCAPMVMVPVGDMFNSSEHDSNVHSICDASTGTMYWRTLRHIDAGEELTQKFELSGKADPIEMVKHFGFAPEGAVRLGWSADDCSQIRQADLPHSESTLLKSLGKLADEQCAEPLKEAAQIAQVAQSSAPLPLLLPEDASRLLWRGSTRRMRARNFLDVSLSHTSVS